MDPQRIIGSLIQGALGGGRKKGSGAMRYLTGSKSPLLNAGTLLTVAGLAWGLIESVKPKTTVPGPISPGTSPPPVSPPPAIPSGDPATKPSAAEPTPTEQDVAEAAAAAALPAEIHRVVRLTISAARADGSLSAPEKEYILSRAREAGIEELVSGELSRPRPLPEIVAGVSDPGMRRDLYRLAFTLVRADEGISGAERIYLAQLAHLLELQPAAVAQLEQETASAIDAAANQG